MRLIQRFLLDQTVPINEHQDGRARSAQDVDCIPFPRSAVAIRFPHHSEDDESLSLFWHEVPHQTCSWLMALYATKDAQELHRGCDVERFVLGRSKPELLCELHGNSFRDVLHGHDRWTAHG